MCVMRQITRAKSISTFWRKKEEKTKKVSKQPQYSNKSALFDNFPSKWNDLFEFLEVFPFITIKEAHDSDLNVNQTRGLLLIMRESLSLFYFSIFRFNALKCHKI